MENKTEEIKNEKQNPDQAFHEHIDQMLAEILGPKPVIVPDTISDSKLDSINQE